MRTSRALHCLQSIPRATRTQPSFSARHLTTSVFRRQTAAPTSTSKPPAQSTAASIPTPGRPAPAKSAPSTSPSSSSSSSTSAPTNDAEPLRSLTEGLSDPPPTLSEDEKQVDWTRSYHGLSSSPFSDTANAILMQELSYDDIEIKPDGIIYLPEIKYRRILNKAFGPGGWGLAPRGETIVTGKLVTREYALVCAGRLVSIARGEQQYFDPDGIPTATEGCKSNALMRCCKDLGIASELWDPRFIRRFLADMAKETIVEHVVTKKRRKHWMRKDDAIKYPFKEVPTPGSR
ncbi:Mgm101p-domain-containing protein [Myriangium duriaei CBS 260.36]|uniref:Mitochondrial genome maintenance protein MGM101 n=1 Tax=Myriangium duriaei CBS 260.36 TaxID=1168546 RepID=A0A9P4IT26_9PEZI|nr:Mgm101p-domain-containing protein [Myriangium duriaei CBS 260.36]